MIKAAKFNSLWKFISETIQQIVNGVKEAQKNIKNEDNKNETFISPRYGSVNNAVKPINFDVAKLF